MHLLKVTASPDSSTFCLICNLRNSNLRKVSSIFIFITVIVLAIIMIMIVIMNTFLYLIYIQHLKSSQVISKSHRTRFHLDLATVNLNQTDTMAKLNHIGLSFSMIQLSSLNLPHLECPQSSLDNLVFIIAQQNKNIFKIHYLEIASRNTHLTWNP